MPPPVLPAQAPMNISSTRMLLAKEGHWSKSQVEKPVVVMMDPTWKAACWMAVSRSGNRPRMFQLIRAMAARMTPKYQRTSSISTLRNLPRMR